MGDLGAVEVGDAGIVSRAAELFVIKSPCVVCCVNGPAAVNCVPSSLGDVESHTATLKSAGRVR